MNICVWSLAELCTAIQYGYTASASHDAVGPKFLRITDIVPDILDWESVPYCTISDDDKKKYWLSDGDIVIARTGATTGYAKQIFNPPEAVFASYLIRLRINEELADPRFIGLLVQSSGYKKFVQSHWGGAAQPNANARTLTGYKLLLPERNFQERIVTVSSTYDDLIATNQRRIQLLVESARLLYREWFVKLHFPGHETTRIKDGVPEGWTYEKLEAAFVLQRGFDLPASERLDGDIPVYASTGLAGFHNQAKVPGPGVVTGRSGTLGEVHFVHEDFWPLNTTLWVKEFKRIRPLLAYFTLGSLGLSVYNAGASVPTLDRKTVHAIDILIPNEGVQGLFESAVMPMFDQIRAIIQYNNKLKQARDLLLPKLMSGALDVSRLTLPQEIAA